MNDPAIMRMFAGVGAIVSDSHFVYSSGRHSSVYINKDALYVHPRDYLGAVPFDGAALRRQCD